MISDLFYYQKVYFKNQNDEKKKIMKFLGHQKMII